MLRFLCARLPTKSYTRRSSLLPTSLFATSSRLEIKNEKHNALGQTAEMDISGILNSIETNLNKHILANNSRTKDKKKPPSPSFPSSPSSASAFQPSAVLRHLSWKVRPADSTKPRSKFVYMLTASSASEPSAAELCTLQPFKLLLQHLNKKAPKMNIEEINDVVSAAARREFTVNLRAPDFSSGGKQEVPVLRAVIKRAVDLLKQLPFRTLLRTMVVLSRDELGFERNTAFSVLTQELIERTSEEPLEYVHWTLLGRSLQDMAEYFEYQDITKLEGVMSDLVQHFRHLLEQDNKAGPGNMIITVQALAILARSSRFEWTDINKTIIDKATHTSYPNTLAHLASLDRIGLMKPNYSYPIIHHILRGAVGGVGQWNVVEIIHVLTSLMQLGFRHEPLLTAMKTRLIELTALDKVDEPSVRAVLLAYAKLNYRDEEMCLALSNVWVKTPPKEGRVLKIMSSLWALTVLSVYSKDVFETGWKLCDVEEPIRLSKSTAKRLVGFHLTLTKEQPTWEFCHALPRSMSFALLQMNWSTIRHTSSRWHAQVQGVLSRLNTGAIVRNEKFNHASKRSVDITLFFPDGTRLAVECNGPTHYLRPSGYNAPVLNPWPLPLPEPPRAKYVPCGDTLFKQRTLEAAGMMVLQIPWWEFYRADKTEQGRRQYMKEKLHALGISTDVVQLDSSAKTLALFRQREWDWKERKQFVASIQELHSLEGEEKEFAGLLAETEPTPGLLEDEEGSSDEDISMPSPSSPSPAGPFRCESFGRGGTEAEQFQQLADDFDETVEAIFGSRDLRSGRSYLVQFKGTAPSDAFWVHEADLVDLPGFPQAEKRFRFGAPHVEKINKTGADFAFSYRDPVSVMPTLDDLAARLPEQKGTEKRKEKMKKPKRK